jgi:chromosome partitioning protein
MLATQIHERDAYRAMFAFGGTLASLDPAQVTNVPAAVKNARAFAAEIVALLKAKAKAPVAEEVA